MRQQSQIALTLLFDDFFPHFEHVRVLMHIEIPTSWVQIVRFKEVLERMPLKHILGLGSMVVIFLFCNVEVGMVDWDHSASRSLIR